MRLTQPKAPDAMRRPALVQLPHVEPVALDDITRVEITPTRLSSRGQRYSVTYRGAILIESARTPAFAACRALLALGITGRLEVWRRDKTCADMQLDIETGAGLTISETDTHGLRVVPWRQFAQDPADPASSWCADGYLWPCPLQYLRSGGKSRVKEANDGHTR